MQPAVLIRSETQTLIVAQVLVLVLAIYVALGLIFAVAFAWRGAACIDRAAADGTWGFRLLIVPGAAALWPLLLTRWIRGAGMPPEERTAHRDAATRRPGETA